MNVHELALAIVRKSSSPDPGVMAEALVDAIDPADYREALLLMARGYVRVVIHETRGVTLQATIPTGGGSRKVDAARGAWRHRILNTSEFVPSIRSWVHLQDATRDQVLEMASHRHGKAAENKAAAERYGALAAEMKRCRVLRVRDLDVSALRAVFAPEGDAA